MNRLNLQLDYYGALNLHKALLEAKFHIDPDNESVSGSPLVAEIYIQIRDYLIESDEKGQWREWFQLKNRPDYRERAIARMKKFRRWDKASSDEKRKIAKTFLAPFLCGEEELNMVIMETDKKY